MKFQVDDQGAPVYYDEIEYFMIKSIKKSLDGKIVLVDESSMVGSDVWYDLINCGLIDEIHAYGDEKQLPPIEEYHKLDDIYKPYFQFWHNFDEPKSVITLRVNYRQQGDLKTFVEAIENTLFNERGDASIPVPLLSGENFSIHASDIAEEDLLYEMMDADIVITPYNKIRDMTNIICRKTKAKLNNVPFKNIPVIGDKIIFVDAIKAEVIVGKHLLKRIVLPKNVCATITEIHDVSIQDNLMTLDIVDETGLEHNNIVVSLNKIMGLTNGGDFPRIDYAYAVTVHSSQGGQWDNVLFLDSHWNGDASKLRYVGITRAKKRLGIISGITNSTESKDAHRSIMIRLANQVK
jgi:exodeoxyribonuclease-5